VRNAIFPDLAQAGDLVAARGTLLGRPMHVLATTDSTNDLAKRGAREGTAHGATWVAEEQTRGRGRQGRAWFGVRGESLLFSVLARVACPPSRLPLIALAAGLAVRDAVARAAPDAPVVMKWPNDVLVDGRKVAGVLVEAATTGSRVSAVVIGIGINVHTRRFPEPIAPHATSVALWATGPPHRGEILADVLATLDADLHLVVSRGLGLLRSRLDAADGLRGKRVRSDSGDEGIASGIDDEGRLVVRATDGALTRWTSSEIHLA
jgi:BirA family biotin operon repressor/biotin-[acetyl-CoA-carboxylase] ligase